MTTQLTLQAVLKRAATDPAFRAQLLANPALGLTEDKLQAMTANPALAEAELSLEMLEQIAGGPQYGVQWTNGLRDDSGTPEG